MTQWHNIEVYKALLTALGARLKLLVLYKRSVHFMAARLRKIFNTPKVVANEPLERFEPDIELGDVPSYDLRLDDSADIELNGMSAILGGVSVPYLEVLEAIANRDTVEGDGVGGSMMLRFRKPISLGGKETRVLNLTFAESAVDEAFKFVERVRQFGADTDVLQGRDSAFRKMFFIQHG